VAGLPGAGLLQLKTREAAAEVLAVKARGALVLQSVLPVLDGHPVDFLVLFSAMASLTGGIGQVDYCAANAFLDVLAQSHRQRGGVPTVSVDWCEWQWDNWTGRVGALDPGVQEALQQQRRTYGLTFAEGMEALGRALASGAPQVIVSTRPLQQVFQQQHSVSDMLAVLAARDRSAQPGGHGSRHARPALATPYVPPGNETEQRLADLWGDLLGIEQIGIHDNFFLLGGHSLLGLQVMTRIDEVFRIELPLSVLFEAPTVAELAAALAAQDGEPSAHRAPEIRRAADPQSAQRMLESLDALSEEEMDRLLADLQKDELQEEEV
jgi:acyl carrier protein